MCVLLVSWRQRSDLPLVLAANRDESYARPSEAPEIARLGGIRVLAPRDLTAGGTWIGVSESGLVVAITNRRDGGFDAERPSRGHLCRQALEQPDAASVLRFVEEETRLRRYNSFNLFFADRARAVVASWNGALATVELVPGAHMLSNEHGVGELEPPHLEPLRADGSPITALRRALRTFVVRHDPEPGSGLVVCKHGGTHGTVSSTLVFVPRAAPGWLEHAPGAPCRTRFVHHALPGAVPVP